jgi:hypothetical protein
MHYIVLLLVVMNVFNFIDATLTLYSIQSGLAVEINPIMNFALSLGPKWFLIIKTLLIAGASIILYKYIEIVPRARYIPLGGCFLFGFIVIYEIFMLTIV